MRAGGLLCLLMMGCTQSVEEERVILPSEIANRTVHLEDDWTFPQTGLVPVQRTDDPRIEEAENNLQAQQYREAAELLIQIVTENPEREVAHSMLSATLIHLGDIQQAIIAAKRVVELSPSAWSYTNLGSVYVLAQQFEDAQEAFEHALERNPKYFLALRNMGSLAYQEKRYVEAEDYFRQFIRIDPEDTYGYVSYGQVLAEQGKLQAAQEVYLYRLQELEWDVEARVRIPSGRTLDLPLALAEVYRRMGNLEQAERWFLQTIVWTWTHEGYWTSEETYADRAYQRLATMLLTLPEMDRLKSVQRLEQWFTDSETHIPAMQQDSERVLFKTWLQVVEAGP